MIMIKTVGDFLNVFGRGAVFFYLVRDRGRATTIVGPCTVQRIFSYSGKDKVWFTVGEVGDDTNIKKMFVSTLVNEFHGVFKTDEEAKAHLIAEQGNEDQNLTGRYQDKNPG